MKRSAFPIRIVGLVGGVTLLALLLVHPVGALPALLQNTPEPSPRPTATPAPYLELAPTQGVAGDATPVAVAGRLWRAGRLVTLYWDVVDAENRLGDPVPVASDGTFQTNFTTPTDPARAFVGLHLVIAVDDGFRAEATFELIAPTPTPTHTPTHTPKPPTPTFTSTPITPTPTFTASPTLTPSPTLRPVTPMVTISPIPPTRPPPVTRVATATRTRTPVPGTPTHTLTPSVTPTPSQTPGPGTPSVTPQATATPVGEISDTGAGWGTIFLWGFVLAGLLVVFRLLRVRSLTG